MGVNELYTYISAFTCYFGAFTITSHLGFVSPTQKELIEENILTSSTLPIFASIGIAARMIATLILPVFIQFNVSINCILVVHCLVGWGGWMLILSANSAALLIIGMALVGYYNGIVVMFILTYIPEISLDNQRRVLSGGFGFVVRIGMFLAFLFGIWIPFRWLAVLGITQIFIFCSLLSFVPTSPVQFVARGLEDRARHTLLYLHGTNVDVDEEIQKIRISTIDKRIGLKESLRTFLDWKVLKPLLIILMLGVLKEFGGHVIMLTFSSKILENQQAMNPKVAALFYPLFLIAGAVVCILILDRCKLKWIIIVASCLQFISYISMSVYFLTLENSSHCFIQYSSLCHLISLWPTFNIALFAFAFALGWGIVFFSLLGLMLTVQREFSTGLADAASNFTAYICVQIFYYLFVYLGGFATFLIFGILQMFGIVFVYFAIKL